MTTFFDTCGNSRGAVLANIFPVFPKGAGEVQGLWIAGPFQEDRIDTIANLARQHLEATGGPPEKLATVRSSKGLHLFQSGLETRAYLTDHEGLELDRDLLDEFLLEMTIPGEVITFEGFHKLVDDKIFILHEKARHDGDTVRWSGSREIRTIKGGRVVLRPPAQPMLMVA